MLIEWPQRWGFNLHGSSAKMYETSGISFDSMILDLEFMDLRNAFILIPLKESPSKTHSKKVFSSYTLPCTIQKIPPKNHKSSHTNRHPKVIPDASSPCRAPMRYTPTPHAPVVRPPRSKTWPCAAKNPPQTPWTSRIWLRCSEFNVERWIPGVICWDYP